MSTKLSIVALVCTLSLLVMCGHAAPAQTKDIVLDHILLALQNTPNDTCLPCLEGKGLPTTLRITHR